jgi:hypothetical protein
MLSMMMLRPSLPSIALSKEAMAASASRSSGMPSAK